MKQYNSNLGLILILFFAWVYFCGWKLLFGKSGKNLLRSSPLFQQGWGERPDGEVLNIDFCSKYFLNI